MKRYPHILIVDDEDKIRVVLRAALDMDGYQISEARDGYAAMKLLEFSDIDAMVLDLNMPILDGLAVLGQLRHLVRKPKVAVLTAHGSIGTALKATQLGASDFLEKPIMPNDLRKSIKAMLASDDADGVDGALLSSANSEEILGRVRTALKVSNHASAESMLMKLADRSDQRTPEFFNLLGVLYHVQGKCMLAEKCFAKAVAADPHYEPALTNLRHIEEFRRTGKGTIQLIVGAEPPLAASSAHTSTRN